MQSRTYFHIENDHTNSACAVIEVPDHVCFYKTHAAFNKSEHGIAFQIQRDSSPFLVTQSRHV